jgi:hypothetical protein
MQQNNFNYFFSKILSIVVPKIGNIIPLYFTPKNIGLKLFFQFCVGITQRPDQIFFSDIIGGHVTGKKKKKRPYQVFMVIKALSHRPFKNKTDTLSYSPTPLLLIRLVWPV